MIRVHRLLRLVAALAVAGSLGAPGAVLADFELALSTNYGGSGSGTPTGTTSAAFNGVVGDFSVLGSFGSSNAPGGMNAVDQLGTWLITNMGTKTETLTIEVSATGFNSPQSPPPLNIYDTVSGSVAAGGTLVSATFQGFADASNSPTPGAGTAGQLINIGTYGGTMSFSGNGQIGGVFSPNGSTYSVSIIETLTLTAGTTLTLTGGNVTVAMPAPTNLLLAMAGVSVLGLWSYSRRKPAVAVAQ